MSVDAFYGLPLQAGQAVAATAGRTAKWAISAYFRAPLRNTAIAALTTMSALAGSNALYNQTGVHPSPMFGSFESRPAKADLTPAMPAPLPAKILAVPQAEEVAAPVREETIAAPTVTRDEVTEMQRKLTELAMFDGKLDGLYGPRTAKAIKAFEASAGRAETGLLTPEIVALIKSAPAKAATTIQVAPLAANPVDAAPAEVQPKESLQLVETEAALPAPQPLAVEATASISTETGGSGISTLAMTSPPEAASEPASTGPTKRSVQTIEVRAPAPELAIVTEAAPAVQNAPIDVLKAATDPKVVGAVQRGLSSLGFLHGTIDGVAGEATAKAIRNFEVYYNYNVTGRVTPELVNLLVQNGAVI